MFKSLGRYEIVAITALAAVTLLIWHFALFGIFAACQQTEKPDEWFVKTASTLDAAVDVWQKIAITLSPVQPSVRPTSFGDADW